LRSSALICRSTGFSAFLGFQASGDYIGATWYDSTLELKTAADSGARVLSGASGLCQPPSHYGTKTTHDGQYPDQIDVSGF
jgi:hypothetical protein